MRAEEKKNRRMTTREQVTQKMPNLGPSFASREITAAAVGASCALGAWWSPDIEEYQGSPHVVLTQNYEFSMHARLSHTLPGRGHTTRGIPNLSSSPSGVCSSTRFLRVPSPMYEVTSTPHNLTLHVEPTRFPYTASTKECHQKRHLSVNSLPPLLSPACQHLRRLFKANVMPTAACFVLI